MGSQRHEHPSTYFVPDRSSHDDLTRLQLQDQMITTAMGGVLPEQPNPEKFQRVLDVGCGTGGWLIETAKTYPTATFLIGVDISTTMVAYAREQAVEAGVSDRVKFQTMDALRMLEFPDIYFDLVNQRSGASYLRTWDWPKLLQEYRRVTRPAGIVRITEGEWCVKSTSPALTELGGLLLDAFFQAGHSFTHQPDGVTSELVPLVERYGFQTVHSSPLRREYCAGTPEWQQFVDDMALTFRMVVPFLRKWTRVPDTYDQLYQQALEQIGLPDFVASGGMLTVWGKKGT